METRPRKNLTQSQALAQAHIAEPGPVQLSPRYQLIVEAFLKDPSSKRRACEAGGYLNATGFIVNRIFAQPDVRAAIAERLEAIRVDSARVLEEAERLAFGDLRDVAVWGPGGVVLKSSDELDDDAAATISEVSQTETKEGTSVKIKRYDKVAALALWMKALKITEGDRPAPDPGGALDLASIPTEALEVLMEAAVSGTLQAVLTQLQKQPTIVDAEVVMPDGEARN